jgi:hypothetical protein
MTTSIFHAIECQPVLCPARAVRDFKLDSDVIHSIRLDSIHSTRFASIRFASLRFDSIRFDLIRYTIDSTRLIRLIRYFSWMMMMMGFEIHFVSINSPKKSKIEDRKPSNDSNLERLIRRHLRKELPLYHPTETQQAPHRQLCVR